MYHPAAALHQCNLRKVIEADFAKLPEFLARMLNGGMPATEATTPVPAHMRSQQAPAPQTEPAALIEPESQQMRLL
jgi:hypothetical protein